MEWTDEIISRLQTLWQEGLSTAEIGRQLSITKNAVVGKAHRLGLPPRPSPIRAAAKPRKGSIGEAQGQPVETQVEGNSEAVTTTPVEPATQNAAPAPVSPVTAAPSVAAPVSAPVIEQTGTSSSSTVTASASAGVSSPPAPQEPVKKPLVNTVTTSRNEEEAPVANKSPQPRKTAEATTMAPDMMLRPLLRPLTTETSPRRGPACCWPNGDPGTPGFHFCGAKPVPGKPYCAEHCAIAYVKLRDRRENVG